MKKLQDEQTALRGRQLHRRSWIPAVKAQIGGWALIVPTLLLFILLLWRPIVIGIAYSFYKIVGSAPVEFVGLKNYVDVLTDTDFLKTLWNTVTYVFWSLIIGLPLPFIAAVVLNEMIYGKSFFKFALYMPVVLPSVVTCLLWRFMYSDGSGGLLNMLLYYFGSAPHTWLSNSNITILLIIIAMTWNGFGSTMIIYLASLQSVDNSLYEAARLDGAGFWTRIRIVLMPHMWGVILLMTVRQIIGIFQITEQPLVMTGGGPNGASMSLGLMNYSYAFLQGRMDKSLALGVVSFLLLIGLTFVYFRLDKKING